MTRKEWTEIASDKNKLAEVMKNAPKLREQIFKLRQEGYKWSQIEKVVNRKNLKERMARHFEIRSLPNWSSKLDEMISNWKGEPEK